MVRMSQDKTDEASSIDGQGNFGSIDGDPPAMRYTEASYQKCYGDAGLTGTYVFSRTMISDSQQFFLHVPKSFG